MVLATVDGLKTTLAQKHQKEIENYFGDSKKALKFLSSVVSAVQKNEALLRCDQVSVINAFMTIAQLEFMPSDVSGEAYVLPYGNKAQFQLGYQGLVTLFYRSGVKSITAEIVYEKDDFKYKNGVVHHEPDIFNDDRGKAIGAYVIVKNDRGGEISKVMSKKQIMAIGKRFSKSFSSSNSPWNEKNDPELWMWKKTIIKQTAKLLPKNDHINIAIAEDNKDTKAMNNRTHLVVEEEEKKDVKEFLGYIENAENEKDLYNVEIELSNHIKEFNIRDKERIGNAINAKKDKFNKKNIVDVKEEVEEGEIIPEFKADDSTTPVEQIDEIIEETFSDKQKKLKK